MGKDIKTAGLLGTAFTMEQDFYKSHLMQKYGSEVFVLNEPDRKIVHNMIYQELCISQMIESSKIEYLRII